MIMVTPYIAKPMDPGQVRKPDDGFTEASDGQSVLLGRFNRLYGVVGAAPLGRAIAAASASSPTDAKPREARAGPANPAPKSPLRDPGPPRQIPAMTRIALRLILLAASASLAACASKGGLTTGSTGPSTVAERHPYVCRIRPAPSTCSSPGPGMSIRARPTTSTPS